MSTILVKFAVLVAVMLLAGHAAPSHAATLSPGAMAPSAAGVSQVEQVNWVCGPNHCVWRPNYRGPVRVFTRNWGPPRGRGCMWVRGPFFAWRHVCP